VNGPVLKRDGRVTLHAPRRDMARPIKRRGSYVSVALVQGRSSGIINERWRKGKSKRRARSTAGQAFTGWMAVGWRVVSNLLHKIVAGCSRKEAQRSRPDV